MNTNLNFDARKQSSGDLQSRLKTRKLLGVGESDGTVPRSKLSQILGGNEFLTHHYPVTWFIWCWQWVTAILLLMHAVMCLVWPNWFLDIVNRLDKHSTSTATQPLYSSLVTPSKSDNANIGFDSCSVINSTISSEARIVILLLGGAYFTMFLIQAYCLSVSNYNILGISQKAVLVFFAIQTAIVCTHHRSVTWHLLSMLTVCLTGCLAIFHSSYSTPSNPALSSSSSSSSASSSCLLGSGGGCCASSNGTGNSNVVRPSGIGVSLIRGSTSTSTSSLPRDGNDSLKLPSCVAITTPVSTFVEKNNNDDNGSS